MTLSQIEQLANKGNLAQGAFNIRATLRFIVIPEFYRRISDVTWLRRHRTLSVVNPTRQYDLPLDFRSMISVGSQDYPLQYIGEDPSLVAEAELATTPARPRGYWIVQDTDSKWRAIRLSTIPDIAYSVPYTYRSRLYFLNDADDVQLDEYIPEDYQPALIEGLKAQMYLDRFGQQDTRYQVAAGKFMEIIEDAKEGAHDLAQRNFAIYAD